MQHPDLPESTGTTEMPVTILPSGSVLNLTDFSSEGASTTATEIDDLTDSVLIAAGLASI